MAFAAWAGLCFGLIAWYEVENLKKRVAELEKAAKAPPAAAEPTRQ
jgi:hypothetical protein